MMRDGERQVAETVDGIRADHVKRYEFAARTIPPSSPRGTRVIDFACGVGYGSRILFQAGHEVTGFDIDTEAIAYAKEHYQGAGQQPAFKVANGNAPGELPEADVAVCFETIEHLEDPRPLLIALRSSARMLIASAPNEAVFPYVQDGKVAAYHYRHYLKNEFNALLNECGWRVTAWHGQMGPEADVEPDANGRTLIAVAERAEEVAERPPSRHISIVGLGPSVDQYLDNVKRMGGRHAFCTETWAINALGDVFQCDLVFHMDDVRIQEIRAAARPASNIAAMLPWLKTSPVPVVTSRAHPDYPALVEYPLEDVLNHLQHDYFNSTAPYAVAMAIHVLAPLVEQGVECKISLFGIDYTLPNQHQAEKGRGCVEFWIGQAVARGIKIALPKSTTLLDACHTRSERLYGYDTVDVKFNMQEDGAVKLEFVERATLPSAEEIEKAYDHSAPIAQQHLTKGQPT